METGQLKRQVPASNPVASSGFEPTATLDDLVEQLRFGPKAERIQAAEALSGLGAGAVVPLCEVLKEPDDDLRIAAAQSLGALGDSRAISPLIEALRSRCSGGSGVKHRRTGRIFVGILFLVIFAVPIVVAIVGGNPGGAYFMAIVGPLITWAAQRQPRGKVFRAITRALEQISEAEPTPALREVLPELNVLAADSLQQDRETRKVLREASERIDALTENLRSLPIAATAAEPDLSLLPTPAEGSTQDSNFLPRVSD